MNFVPALKKLFALFVIMVSYNCEDKKDSTTHLETKSTSLQVLLDDIKNKDLSPQTRLLKSDEAIAFARSTRNDSLEFLTFNKKMLLLNELNLYESSKKLNQQIIAWSKSFPTQEYYAEANFNFANYFNERQQFDSAYYYFNQARIEFIKFKDKEGVAKSNINMAVILNDTGSYFSSETTSLEAIKNLQDQPNHPYLIPAYNSLAISSGYMHNYTEELYWYNKALNLTDDPYYIASLKNNKAVAFTMLKKYDEAIELLNQLKSDSNLNDYPELEARIMDNLAYAKWLKNPHADVYAEFENALKIFSSIHDYQGQSVTLDHLVEYFEFKNPPKALDYAYKKYNISLITKNAESRLSALKHILNFNTGSDKLKEFIHLSDSLQIAASNSKYQFAKIKFDSDANRSQIQNLLLSKANNELKLERAKISIIITITCFIIAVIIFLSYLYYNREKRKHEKAKIIYETEVGLSQKLHDELSNDLFSTITLVDSVEFEDQELKEKLINNLDHIYAQTRNISRQNNQIDTENFKSELDMMLASYKSAHTNILTKGIESIHWEKISSEVKIVVYRVLMELMTNMKKHSNCNLVVISFLYEKKKLEIKYVDNGSVNHTIPPIIKNGIRNVESRISSINGTIKFDNSKGYKAFLSIPV